MIAAMDEKWVRSLERLAAANAAANRERLRRLTLEESIREFEALCEEVHRGFPEVPVRHDPSPGLAKFWKRS